jgi:predicted  nucleic acid-binding Zn-ribbon protein
MNRISFRSLVPVIALGLLAGCGSSDTRQVNAPPPPQESGREAMAAPAASKLGAPSVADFKSNLIACKSQIDSTLAALADVTNPNTTDLRGAFDKYADQLARTEAQAQDVKTEATAMRTARQTYFARWEAKASEIDNPNIRASAEARRQRLRDAHERIITESEQLRDSYQPFMKDLQDIRKFLSADLSKQSVTMLGDVNNKCQADGGVVKQKINAIVAELDSIEAGGQ